MDIYGIQKLTLLDYPGKVACTLFTKGCNLACPFCHNASLVIKPNDGSPIDSDELFSFLKSRTKILDGVCITGGEPLIQNDIADFIRFLKELGYLVKLDTNGMLPNKLQALIDAKLIDYVAMDIKNSPTRYPETSGIPELDLSNIKRSISILINGTLPYEFRTTVVKEFHTNDDIRSICEMIKGAKAYFLQRFVDSGDLIGSNMHALSNDEMHQMLEIAREFVPSSELRGV